MTNEFYTDKNQLSTFKVRRKPYDSVKVNRVGAFGQCITQALITSGTSVPVAEGDLYIPSVNNGIEVKLTDSMHEWRIPLHQLEAFSRLAEFPYDGFWFFLFVYRNWYIPSGRPRSSTALSVYNETTDIRSFIANNMQGLFVFHIDFIQALKDKQICRVSNKSIPLHPGRESLNIRPAHMRRIIEGDSWRDVITDPKSWKLKHVNLRLKCQFDMFEQYDISLSVRILGRKKDVRQISKLLPA